MRYLEMTTGKTGFIGVGNMAGAILDGVLSSGIQKPENIVLFDICAEKAQRFIDMGCSLADSECSLVDSCDTVFLAIKPQGFPELLEKIKDRLNADKLVISIAAGIGIDYINERVGKTLPVIRVLPNTPMLVGCGVSAITYRAPVTQEQYQFACSVFASCGEVYFVEEDKFNEIIAVHSSSPAFVFMMMRAMADSAEKQGIDRNQALKMIAGTFIGAAKLFEQSDKTCDELIAMVTSKGGTTAAALASFEGNDYSGIVDEAMKACTARAYELAEQK